MPQTIVPTEMRFDARYEKHNAVGNNDSTAKKATIEFERQWLSKNKTKKNKILLLNNNQAKISAVTLAPTEVRDRGIASEQQNQSPSPTST